MVRRREDVWYYADQNINPRGTAADRVAERVAGVEHGHVTVVEILSVRVRQRPPDYQPTNLDDWPEGQVLVFVSALVDDGAERDDHRSVHR